RVNVEELRAEFDAGVRLIDFGLAAVSASGRRRVFGLAPVSTYGRCRHMFAVAGGHRHAVRVLRLLTGGTQMSLSRRISPSGLARRMMFPYCSGLLNRPM